MAETALPLRSFLFVPANRPDRFDKACGAGADAVVVDLEDAVAAAEKESGRQAVRSWLTPARCVWLRINSMPDELARDLPLLHLRGIAGVLVPKVEDADHFERIAAEAPAGLPLIPLIESARGLAQAQALASAPSVVRLAFGSVDFSLDLGLGGGREELLMARSQLVLVSRLVGLQAPVDGVTVALGDPAAVADDVAYARRLGFGGKLCIHPRQVDAVNRGFAPSDAEIGWARRVVAAAEGARDNAVRVDGQLVDRPIIERARALLRQAAFER